MYFGESFMLSFCISDWRKQSGSIMDEREMIKFAADSHRNLCILIIRFCSDFGISFIGAEVDTFAIYVRPIHNF